jgi:hypothetical protein
MSDKKTTRVQMDLPETSLQRLKVLKDKTEAASYAEVTKNAYRLYERMVGYAENGYTFLVRDPEGNLERLEIFV